MTPFVALVMPSYNAAATIAEALASVWAQTRPVDRLLLVDDGSTDDTVAIARRVSVGRPLVVVAKPSSRPRGPAASRNVALATLPDTALVCFLDADDLALPNHVALLTAALVAHPEAGVAFGRVHLFGDLDHTQEWLTGTALPANVFWHQWEENRIMVGASAFRKALVTEIGGFREELTACSDFEFFCRATWERTVIALPDVTVRYRKHGTSVSRQFAHARQQEQEARHAFLAWLLAHGLVDYCGGRTLHAVWGEAWVRRLAECWSARQWGLMGTLLGLYRQLPDAVKSPAVRRARRRWRVRRVAVPLARLWDWARNALDAPARPRLSWPHGDT